MLLSRDDGNRSNTWCFFFFFVSRRWRANQEHVGRQQDRSCSWTHQEFIADGRDERYDNRITARGISKAQRLGWRTLETSNGLLSWTRWVWTCLFGRLHLRWRINTVGVDEISAQRKSDPQLSDSWTKMAAKRRSRSWSVWVCLSWCVVSVSHSGWDWSGSESSKKSYLHKWGLMT